MKRIVISSKFSVLTAFLSSTSTPYAADAATVVLKASTPYLCRTVNQAGTETLAAIYTNSQQVRYEDLMNQKPLLPPELDTGNYLRVNFFVAGDIGDSGKGTAYRDFPLSFTQDGKALLWHSAQANPLDGEEYDQVMCSGGSGHTEPKFIADFGAIMKTRPEQFVDIMTKGPNQEVSFYGFYADSIFDICEGCLGPVYTFMTDTSQTSLQQYVETEKNRHSYLALSATAPTLVFRSRTFYSYHDQISLHTGIESYPMAYNSGSGGALSLRNEEEVYSGKLKVQFGGFSSNVYFQGARQPLPPILCNPRNFFADTRQMVAPFSYTFSTELGDPVEELSEAMKKL